METNVEVCANERNGAQRWLTVALAAKYSSLSTKAIRLAIQKGELPRRKVGRRFIVDARAIDEWLTGETVVQ